MWSFWSSLDPWGSNSKSCLSLLRNNCSCCTKRLPFCATYRNVSLYTFWCQRWRSESPSWRVSYYGLHRIHLRVTRQLLLYRSSSHPLEGLYRCWRAFHWSWVWGTGDSCICWLRRLWRSDSVPRMYAFLRSIPWLYRSRLSCDIPRCLCRRYQTHLGWFARRCLGSSYWSVFAAWFY